MLGIGREDDPAGTTGSAQPVHSSHRNSGWPAWPEPLDQRLVDDISNVNVEEMKASSHSLKLTMMVAIAAHSKNSSTMVGLNKNLKPQLEFITVH